MVVNLTQNETNGLNKIHLTIINKSYKFKILY